MMSQAGMSRDRRQCPRAAALVGNRIGVANAEREVRVRIEEERRDVIVEDDEQDVWLLFGEPPLHGRVCLKDGRPDRIVLFLPVERKPDGGRMRSCDSSEDSRHMKSPDGARRRASIQSTSRWKIAVRTPQTDRAEPEQNNLILVWIV